MKRIYSLSRPQRAVYYREKLAGGTISNICCSSLFNKKYSEEEIKNAIVSVYQQNDALRIRIKEENGNPVQYFSDSYPENVDVLYFKNKEDLDEFGQKWAKEPFAFENNSLCELKAVVLPDRSGAICRLHHIVADAWGIALIPAQLSKILRNEEIETFSYRDFIESDEKYSKSQRHDEDRCFFEEKFPENPYPVYLSDQHALSFVAKRKSFDIDREESRRFIEYAKKYSVSPFVLFLTVLSVCFSRMKMNAEKFYIGTTFLNRSGFVEKNTVGTYAPALPFMITVDNNRNFTENMSETRKIVLLHIRHGKYNYNELLNDLRHKFNFQGKLFDVSLTYMNMSIYGECDSTWYFNCTQNETLHIHIDDRDAKGVLTFNYDYLTDIFTENDIEKFHSAMMLLLEDAINNPDKKISELEIAPKEDLSILHGERTVLPESATIPSLFEEMVKKKADEICVVTDYKNYTFSEFNNLAKLIDSEIRKITLGKKQPVAVVAERSIEMYASIYAIVRGGNAYLPIDPAYPKERIGYMLENSGAELVLAQDKFCGLFDKIKVLDVSEIIKDGHVQTEDQPVSALPEDTAYIIYTSGSTGRPKGAKISHGSLLNRILWMEKAYPLDENSVILQKTPYTFDVSLWEIFWWGISGRKMAFMKPDEYFLPAKITDEIYRKKATVAHFVPSVLDLFVKYLENDPKEREKVSTLKDVFVSGEVLNASLINRFYVMFSAEDVKIHNLYGPTECAVDVSFYDCKARESDPVPIGKPIDNTDIFILDNNMQAVPKGVVGEICIGGTNVGQGYVNNEALTNEVFLKNPFGEGQIYKTGDLGYINSENKIIFSCRKDTQIKLNGQRIELTEIENAISEIDGISQSAVVVRKNNEGNQILCAFYSGEKRGNSEIRKELGKKLPNYMIPQIITHLDEMPLTSSGKIDRLSLPAINLENIVCDKEFVEARTEEEKALLEAVKDVLKIDRVSVTDNFFELGGDSIQAIFVVSALEKAGFELSVSDIALHGTISKIALLIKPTDNPELEWGKQSYKTIPFTPIMKLYSNIGELKLKDLAQTQIVSCGKFGEIEIRKALNAIVKHHDMLRAVLDKTGLKVKSFEECKPYEMKVKDLRGRKDCAEFVENDCEGIDLDLENGPLVNTVVYLTDSENFLKITIHHFVIDGVSWRVFADDLSIALEQLSNGREIRLPEKTASFRAWIENLEDYKRTSAVNEFKYWDGILNSLNKLPDVIPNSIEVHEYEEYSFTLEKTFTEQLLTSANKAFGTHADELLLSALGTALKELYGKNDFGVCIETHGREQLHKNTDVSRTVGWFTSYFPMVLKCGDTLNETIVNIKETIRGVPKKGVAYPLFFGRIPEKTELIYNFNGVLREGNKFTKETFRKNAARNAIPDKIAINSIVLNGEFCVFVSFKGNIQANVASDIGIEYEKQLKNLIIYCTEYKGSVKTLSDYSDHDLKESELEEFERMFNETEDE